MGAHRLRRSGQTCKRRRSPCLRLAGRLGDGLHRRAPGDRGRAPTRGGASGRAVARARARPGRTGAAAVRAARVRRLPRLSRPREGRCVARVSRLRPPPARVVLVQDAWLLPELRGSAHGGEGSALGGPGDPVGGDAGLPARPLAAQTPTRRFGGTARPREASASHAAAWREGGPAGPRCAAFEGYERVVFGERPRGAGAVVSLCPATGQLGRVRFARPGDWGASGLRARAIGARQVCAPGDPTGNASSPRFDGTLG